MILYILIGIINVIFAINIIKCAVKLHKDDIDKAKKEDTLRNSCQLVITNLCINLICILIVAISLT